MRNIVQLITVLAVAAAIKLYYSTAGVEDLAWMLGPTTFLVELVTGAGFAFESGAGYLSRDGSFLIAPVCSGINFFITAFLLLAIYRVWRGQTIESEDTPGENKSRWSDWLFLPVSLIAAYVTTLVANTVRISIAYSIRNNTHGLDWATAEQIHRFEGIVVYFGFLLALFFAAERFYSKKAAAEKKPAFRLLTLLLPLAVYYAVAFFVPLLNGAASDAYFWRHSIYVLLLPVPPVTFLAIIRYFRSAHHIKGRLRYHTNTQPLT